MRYRARSAHAPDRAGSWKMSRGHRLRFERRPTPWKGWIWCTSADGRSAWVPESWVSIEGETCLALRDYDAIELAIEAGTMVTAEIVESGWAWVRTETGDEGWVPFDCLE